MQATVYVSQTRVGFDEAELIALAQLAAAKNAHFGISGYLYFERERFVQYIEGPADALAQLMKNIAADDRHQVLRTVQQALPGARRFPDWHMKQIDRAMLNELRMEHLLTERLLLRSLWPQDAEWEQSVWRLVEKLHRQEGKR